MFNTLLRSRVSWPFRQLSHRHILELNRWCSIPCVYTRSTLRERRLTTSTRAGKRGPNTSYFRLRTLTPERLSVVGQEVIDLSGKFHSLVPTAIKGPRLYCVYGLERPKRDGSQYVPFPENTKGVFYFHNAPGMPEFYAGVRFRLCDSAAEFEHGQDLLDLKGDPWGYKILEIVKHKEQEAFLALLRAEKLVDEKLVNDINKSDITQNIGNYHYSLFDPFYLNVGRMKMKMGYVTREKLVRLTLPRNVFKNQKSSFPMTGSIKVQFELSHLAEHKKQGPTLVIRVLDIVEPITFDPLYCGNKIPVPVPGALLHQAFYKGQRVLCIPLKQQPMADDLLELMKIS